MGTNYQVMFYLLLTMAFVHVFGETNNRKLIFLPCGGTSKVKHTVVEEVRNNSVKLCEYRIEPYSQRVHQLYFNLNFNLSQPTVPGPDNNLTVPECLHEYIKIANYTFCGAETLQNVYIPFGYSVNVSSINISIALRGFSESFTPSEQPLNLIIIQLDADCAEDSIDCQPDRFLPAPSGCLQYYKANSGLIKSFNYNDGLGVYPAGMKYTICIRKTEKTLALRLKFLKFGLRHRSDLGNNQSKSCSLTEDYLMIPKNFILSSSEVLQDLPIVQDYYICDDNFTNRTLYSFNFEDTSSGFFKLIFYSHRNYTGKGSGFFIKYTAINQFI